MKRGLNDPRDPFRVDSFQYHTLVVHTLIEKKKWGKVLAHAFNCDILPLKMAKMLFLDTFRPNRLTKHNLGAKQTFLVAKIFYIPLPHYVTQKVSSIGIARQYLIVSDGSTY